MPQGTTGPGTDELMAIVTAGDETAHWSSGALVRPGRRRWGGRRYLAHAVLHPINFTLLLVAGSLGLLLGAVWSIPALLVLDGVALMVLSRRPRYRRFVEELEARAERAQLARRLSAVLAGISTKHRQEYELMARQLSEMRWHGGTAQAFIDEHLEPTRLLANYLRLAMIHRQWQQAQDAVDRAALTAEIHEVEMRLEDADSPAIAAALGQRQDVLAKRADHWDRMQERLQTVRQEMHIARDLVALFSSLTASAANIDETREELNACLRELGRCEPTIRQLTALEDVQLIRTTTAPALGPSAATGSGNGQREHAPALPVRGLSWQ